MHIGASFAAKPAYLITVLILLSITHSQIANCTASQVDPLRGCLACANGTSSVINISTSRIVCSTLTNCIVVSSNGSCIQCNSNSTLDTYLGVCSSLVNGCMTLYNNTCVQCYPNNYKLNTSSNTCVLTIIDYCWQKIVGSCSQCSDENVIVPTSNCSISSSLCANFDYTIWTCLSCPVGKILHSSGIYCYDNSSIANCLIVSSGNLCVECNAGYYVSGVGCQSGSAINMYLQLIPSNYYLNTSASLQSACISLNQYFLNSSCISLNSTINYCLSASNSTCTTCLPQFYLNASGLCKPCSQYQNCFACDSYNCKLCLPSYYLVVSLSSISISTFFSAQSLGSSSKCLPCSIYGCLYCRMEFDSTGINHLRCDSCLFGYSLANYTCYSCPNSTYFDTNLKSCQKCSVINCQYCSNSPLSCDQCLGSYYYSANSSTCELISNVLANNSLTQSNVYEILNKSLPYSSVSIVNDQKLLVTKCAGDSNGYTCLCSNLTGVIYSSLCYPLYSNITSLTLGATLVGSATTALSKLTYTSNLALLGLLSELPNYNFSYQPLTGQLISLEQLAAHLQIVTNVIRNTPAALLAQLAALSQLVFSQDASKTFSAYTPTVFTGKGYYFKFTPSSIEADDASFVSTVQTGTRQSQLIYIFINGTNDTTIKRITGTAVVFLNQNVTSQISLKLKKLSFLGNGQQYIVMQNDNQISYSISSDVNGYVTVSNISTSTSSTLNAYYVSSTKSSAIADLYSSERIENIIYQNSFIYILAFMGLYLFLLPLCALVDFVDNKATKRKQGKSEEQSYQGIKNRNEPEMEEEIILHINYKDFFPIYNIANTDRPQRLLKVCLFIINTEHGVTFLTLIYFHLPGGQPLVAVLLAIPAYICTVIMGYLCGIFTLRVPGNWKYCLNLVTLGYWILWVAVMQRFTSQDYPAYVFTFVIIFFLLDMLIDFLETLLMYFTIKQDERQIKLFQALSRWLSYRGYYEFDKMAKKINEIREAV